MLVFGNSVFGVDGIFGNDGVSTVKSRFSVFTIMGYDDCEGSWCFDLGGFVAVVAVVAVVALAFVAVVH